MTYKKYAFPGCAILFSVVFCSASHAASVTIGFDDYPAGTIITDQYATLGVLFSIDGHVSAQPMTASQIPGELNPSPPNGLVNSFDPIGAPTLPIRATFVNPGDGVTPWVTSAVSFTYMSDQPAFGRMEAYNLIGTLLDSTVSVETGENVFETLSVSGDGISYVLIYPDADVWVDDFTFNSPEPAPVTVAGTTWLLAPGFLGLLGTMLTSQRKAQ